jgi:hypothetical protein
VGARWRFSLRPDPQAAPMALGMAQWQAAIDALLAADALIWHDTDKRGRPRERDCRPALRGLHLETADAPTALGGEVVLALDALVDGEGRSLRPSQLVPWLSEPLPWPIRLGHQCRTALMLRQA